MKINLPPRRLIPRWRRISATLKEHEASSPLKREPKPMRLDSERFEESLYTWSESGTSGALADVLSFGIDPSMRDRVIDVARKAQREGRFLGGAQKEFIDQLLSDPADPTQDTEMSTQVRIQEIRTILRADPANPLTLLDLGQHQLTTGNGIRAERSVKTAAGLIPNSRIVLRTLARLHVHLGRMPESSDKVQESLKRIALHPRTPTDPWLMATEIALSEVAGTNSKFASKGLRFIKEGKAAAADLSELAGALGNLELRAGNVKRARNLFKVALINPNDNVLAQVVTQHTHLGIDVQKSSPIQIERKSATEAQTLLAWEALRMEDARTFALSWHDEEPFSSRPLHFLTTLLAVTCNYDLAETYARRGLISDPTDPGLLANLSYALANSGKTKEVEPLLRRLLKLSPSKYEPVVLATRGLIAMKHGLHSVGDQLYQEAIGLFRARGDRQMSALCASYYARAAHDTSHPNQEQIKLTAIDMHTKSSTPDSSFVLSNLCHLQLAAPAAPSTRNEQRWEWDKNTGSLTPLKSTPGLTAGPKITNRK